MDAVQNDEAHLDGCHWAKVILAQVESTGPAQSCSDSSLVQVPIASFCFYRTVVHLAFTVSPVSYIKNAIC